MKKNRRGTAALLANPAPLGLGAFLAAVGGVLLWVSGGSGWYVVRSAGGELPPLMTVFVLWLLCYALYGFLMAAVVLGCVEQADRAGLALGALAASYLCSLIWYALFFCTRMVIFAGLILILAAAALIFAGIQFRRAPILTLAAAGVLLCAEIGFVCLTFTAIL